VRTAACVGPDDAGLAKLFEPMIDDGLGLNLQAERTYLPVQTARKGMLAALDAIPSHGVSPMIRSLVSGWASRALAVRAERNGLRTPKKPTDQSISIVSTPPPSSFLRLRSSELPVRSPFLIPSPFSRARVSLMLGNKVARAVVRSTSDRRSSSSETAGARAGSNWASCKISLTICQSVFP
jgi:hypothetical protein